MNLKARKQTSAGSLPGSDDLLLAEKSAAGDRLAFEQIYRRHQDRVYGLCLRLTADRNAAEILTQDTFVKAWISIGGYSGRGDMGGWLARIAVNLQRDGFRHQARQDRLVQEALQEGATRQVDRGHVIPLLTAMDLEKCIARLPKGARTIFVLSEIEGFAQQEIASLLDVATGTVKAQLHRARKLLRDQLQDQSQDPSQGLSGLEANRNKGKSNE